MRAEHQHLVLLPNTDQQRPRHRAATQVERGPHLGIGHPLPGGITLEVRQITQIDHPQRELALRRGGHPLERFVVLDSDRGPQRSVPSGHIPQRPLQSGNIDLALEAESPGDVVLDPVGVVLVQEPEPLLGP